MLQTVPSIPDVRTPPKRRAPGRARTVNREVPRDPGLVDMFRIACLPRYRAATFIGAIWGGSVPFAVYMLAHYYIDHNLWTVAALTASGGCNLSAFCALLVLGGLTYSVSTVAQLTALAVQSMPKAIGFTILMEGVMVAAPAELGWLSVYALVLLCCINAVKTGVTLARGSTLHGTTAEVVP